jgi:hypothetical protein
MKKLFVLAMVLATGSVASAGLSLSLSSNMIWPGSHVTVSVVPTGSQLQDVGLWFGIHGGTSVDVSAAVNFVNGNAPIMLDSDTAAAFGFEQVVFVDLVGPLNPSTGQYSAMPSPAFAGMGLAWDWPWLGDLSVTIFDPAYAGAGGAYTTFDQKSLFIIPEPMTLGFLALGGLFLRRGRSVV